MFKKFVLATLLAASLGGLATAQAASVVYVQIGPPPMREEIIPAPRRGYAWAPGYWRWHNQQHVWVNGNWVRERPGYRYITPQWQENNGRWNMRSGRWDRDHDGIPNRVDRDRDGDGVPNRVDRRPNDPTRR